MPISVVIGRINIVDYFVYAQDVPINMTLCQGNAHNVGIMHGTSLLLRINVNDSGVFLHVTHYYLLLLVWILTLMRAWVDFHFLLSPPPLFFGLTDCCCLFCLPILLLTYKHNPRSSLIHAVQHHGHGLCRLSNDLRHTWGLWNHFKAC